MSLDRPAYCLSPGIDAVRTRDAVVFRGNGLSVRLEGASADSFAAAILPLLTVPRALDDLAAALPQVAASDLAAHLDELVGAGVLLRRDAVTEPPGAEPPGGGLPGGGLPGGGLLVFA